MNPQLVELHSAIADIWTHIDDQGQAPLLCRQLGAAMQFSGVTGLQMLGQELHLAAQSEKTNKVFTDQYEWPNLRELVEESMSSAFAGQSFPAAALLAINSIRANDGRPLFSASHWQADVVSVTELLSDETEREKLKPWLAKAAQLFKLAVIQVIKGEADGLRALQKLVPRLVQVTRRFASHGLWLQVEQFVEQLTPQQAALQLPQLLLRHILQVLVNIAKQDLPEAPLTHADNLAKQLAVYRLRDHQKLTSWRQLSRDERLGESIQALQTLQNALLDFFEAGSEFDVLVSVPDLARTFAEKVAKSSASDLSPYAMGVGQYVQQQVLGRKILPSAERIEQMTRVVVALEVALQRHAWGLDHTSLINSIQRSFDRLTEDLLDVPANEDTVDATLPDDTLVAAADDTPSEDEDDGIDQELLDIFIEEAREVLEDMAGHLVDEDLSQSAITEIRRGYHTIKGSGRMVKAESIGEFAWALENFFNQYLQGVSNLSIDPALLIEKANKELSEQVKALEAGNKRWMPVIASHMMPLLEEQASGKEVTAHRWQQCFAEVELAVSNEGATLPANKAVEDGIQMLLACGDVLDEIYPATLARDIDFPWHVEAHKLSQQAQTLEHKHQKLAQLLNAMADFLLRHDVTETVLERFEVALQQAFDALNLIAAEQPVTIDDKYIEALSVQLDDDVDTSFAEQQPLADDSALPVTASSQEDSSGKKSATSSVEEEVDSELVDIFTEEATEICENLDTALTRWQLNPNDHTVLPEVLRLLHTLKGGARMVGWRDMAGATHDFESELLTLDKQIAPSTAKIQAWQAQYRAINTLLLAHTGLADEEDAFIEGSAAPPMIVDSLKIAVDELEELANISGEMSINRSQFAEQSMSLAKSMDDLALAQQRLLDQLRRLDIQTQAQITYRQEQVGSGAEDFDPLEMDRYTMLQQLTNSLLESVSDVADIKSTSEEILRNMDTTLVQQGRLNKSMADKLHTARMIPVSRLLPKLRRLVNQLSDELGKPVQFVAEQIEGELQRSVLERIGTSLEHIIRNALDHGIESPEQRATIAKSVMGTIRLTVKRRDNELVFVMSDDGGGIDRNIILKKAIERGVIGKEEELPPDEVLKLIMRPGFSTAERVTEISGRGVGLDVVDSEMLSLGGRVEVQSIVDHGTEFSLAVPFLQSLNRALMVEVAGQRFAIPFAGVEGIMRLPRRELVSLLENDEPAVGYGNRRYAFCRLEDILGLENTTNPLEVEYSPVVLFKTGDGNFAVRVDVLRGSRELVVKSLGPQFGQLLGVAGATIMGDGQVLTILDLPPLLRTWNLGLAFLKDGEEHLASAERHPCIMIVDDSITVRKITSRLLERYDYEVMMAKDGVEGLAQLEQQVPAAILLDVEMPRMDGFEFATHVRHNALWKDIPIIMISSRSGKKHRQRADDIGVDYLLSKPYREEQLIELLQQTLSSAEGGEQ